MLFDDRLATVLRAGAQGETALRTQYRQLLDLLGSMPAAAERSAQVEAALERLQVAIAKIPAREQSQILREPGLRLRNRALTFCLAHAEPQVAAAAMATAQLSQSDWLSLIPRLPIVARGFLRHRRDLPASVKQLLERLGVHDLILPEPLRVLQPAQEAEAPPETPTSAPATEQAVETATPAVERQGQDVWISSLVRRIEEFRRNRQEAAETARAPRLPLDDSAAPGEDAVLRTIDFETDVRGVVTWADQASAPMLVGLSLNPEGGARIAKMDTHAARAINQRLPLRGVRLSFDAAPLIAGDWQMDAVPVFDAASGSFRGYRGRMRRPLERPDPGHTGHADQLRQILHELRTPVNAIQGFAEIIQQQMFGPAPNEYRALAAAIGVDSARLLAGFEEVDRLARLESGALELDEGTADLRAIVADNLQRLEGVLRPRNARIALEVEGSHFTLGMGHSDTAVMTWRLLAMLAGSLAPAEVIGLTMASNGEEIWLHAELPASLDRSDDLETAASNDPQRVVSASMFGSGFAFRLVRAELRAAGGSIERVDGALLIRLPVLTGGAGSHSVAG